MNILQIAALSLCAFAVSCQKKFLGPEDVLQPPIVEVHDSVTRLSEFYLIQPNAAADTLKHYQITYDGLARVNTITTYFSGIAYPHLFSVATYYYSGTDSMAYEKIEKFPELTGTDTMQTTFYYYDNLKRLVKDSINYPNKVEVAQFNYSASMVTAIKNFDYFVYPFTSTETDTGYINSAGNIARLSRWDASGGSNYFIDFVYDDKPNPFYQLNIRSTFSPVYNVDDLILGLDYYLQKNNILQVVETFSLTTYNTVFTYSYNTSGLPALQYVTFFRNDRGDSFLEFIYKKM